MIESIVGVLGTVMFGIAAWAVQLSNRIAVAEADIVNVGIRIEDRLKDIKDRLERIERHVLNGHVDR